VDGVDVEEAQVQDALEAVRGELVGEVDQGAGRRGEREPVDVGVMSSGSSDVVRGTRMPGREQLRRSGDCPSFCV